MTVDPKKSGAKYSALYPTYGINIVDFHLFKEDNALLHHYTLYEQELQQVLTNTENKALFNLTFFELKKHPTEKTKRHVKYWLDYFNLGKVDGEAPEYIQEASEIIAYQNLAKEEREMVDVLEKAREDYKASIEYAEEKGREEEKHWLAKQLLADRMSLEIVQRYTGLDIETLKHLDKKTKDK
ncbi:Rpn family recombination-promoting nuclease/putative transposase [Listeria sp. PSOL-1]|uniref:Rpn family recombination-promoting nuclease/putative transposase n=1 Tax=Listeria sp. PSOL-1 TaxID=1844999 RepID=UPI0013D868AA|nr:Rpn family recombination-promoting nuclease/putative transposase [Listeria sp. PSOL-1]